MAMKLNQNQQGTTREKGMAAILVTIIMMVVISIIVLGFAQVVRREQRNALDNQLSTQAYYAAESGINLAQSELKANPALPEKNTCNDTGVFAGKFDVGEEAEITCLLITKKLPDLQYQQVGMHSVPMLVQADNGENITKISISWESPTSTSLSGCATTSNHPSSGSNCQPVLRLDVVPVAGLDANNAPARQFTTFLYPVTTSSSPLIYSAGSVQGANNVRCTAAGTPKKCTATITGLSANQYALRLMSLYGESNVAVSAESLTGPVDLINGQVRIDATAKASDVLKRVQARVSLTTPVPDFAITAGGAGICKRYQKIGSDVTVASGSPTFCDIP